MAKTEMTSVMKNTLANFFHCTDEELNCCNDATDTRREF